MVFIISGIWVIFTELKFIKTKIFGTTIICGEESYYRLHQNPTRVERSRDSEKKCYLSMPMVE